MTFPRFRHPSGTEIAINPAFVIKVIHDDNEGPDPTTRILVADSMFIDDPTGRPVCVGPELITVVGRFDSVVSKLNPRHVVEVAL